MILLLGASSFIGRSTYEALGESVAIGTYRSNKVPGCLYFDATKMRLSEVVPQDSDISHAVIIYAEPSIDACKADIERSYDINVRSAKQVIDDLIKQGIKPVFMSSDNVFGGKRGGYTEEDRPDPINVYGDQKAEVEAYLAQACNDYLVLRLSKVFGTDPTDDRILSAWVKQVRNDEEIRCACDQVFSPMHVDDVAAVTSAAVRLNLNGIYHVAGPEAFSRLGVLQTLLGVMGTEARVVECSIKDFNFLDKRPLDVSMDIGRIREATGLEFKTVRASCEELVKKL